VTKKWYMVWRERERERERERVRGYVCVCGRAQEGSWEWTGTGGFVGVDGHPNSAEFRIQISTTKLVILISIQYAAAYSILTISQL